MVFLSSHEAFGGIRGGPRGSKALFSNYITNSQELY